MKNSPRKFRSVLRLALATVVAATLGFGQALIGTSAANAADIGSGVTNLNVTIEGPETTVVSWAASYSVKGSFSLPNSAQPGDTFSWNMPHQVNWQRDITLEINGVKLVDVVIENSIATFRVRDEAASLIDRTVGFSFPGRFKNDQSFLSPPAQILEVSANGKVLASKSVTVTKPPVPTAPTGHYKQLWFNYDDECRIKVADCITARIYLKAGDNGMVHFSDKAQSGWQFKCDSFYVARETFTESGSSSTNVSSSQLLNLICTPDSLSFSIDTTGTPANTAYRIVARLNAVVPGGSGLVEYENTADIETKDGPTQVNRTLTSQYAGGYVVGSSIWIRKIDAAGNDANEKDQAIELPTGATKLKYAVVNNGDQQLTDVKVADEVKVGNAKVKNLKCVFPDKTEGTQWAGPFKPQATFNCTAELSEVVGYHHNEAKVTVTGVNHEPITRTDPYWAHKHERVAVGNKVWIDANRNGKLDEGEPGKGDVTDHAAPSPAGRFPLSDTPSRRGGHASDGRLWRAQHAAPAHASPQNRARSHAAGRRAPRHSKAPG